MVRNILFSLTNLNESLLPQNVVLNVWLEFPKHHINISIPSEIMKFFS